MTRLQQPLRKQRYGLLSQHIFSDPPTRYRLVVWISYVCDAARCVAAGETTSPRIRTIRPTATTVKGDTMSRIILVLCFVALPFLTGCDRGGPLGMTSITKPIMSDVYSRFVRSALM